MELFKMVHGHNVHWSNIEAFYEPDRGRGRCCGWVLPARGKPARPRSVVYGKPWAFRKRALGPWIENEIRMRISITSTV